MIEIKRERDVCVHCFKNYFYRYSPPFKECYRWLGGSIGVAMALFWSWKTSCFQKGFYKWKRIVTTYVSVHTYDKDLLIAYAFCVPFHLQVGCILEDWET